MRMVMMSGLGRGTPSVFSSVVRHSMGPSYALGATGAEWYQRATDAVAKFQELLGRVARIAHKAARETIVDWIGVNGVDGTPMDRYYSVLYDIGQAESYAKLNTTNFERSQLQNRVIKLEAFNRELATKVKNAEDYYGILPDPVVIERFVNVPGAPSGANWVVPAAVGVGVIAVVALINALA